MPRPASFRYLKTSPEIIRLAVMLYIQFPISLRNVEILPHEREVDVSHETVRYWWNRFGPMFASEIRRKRVQQLRASSEWKWHLDEVFVKVNGKRHYLWRAVDHEGEVLETVVTKRRNKQAALKFLKKLLKRRGCAEEIVMDRFASYRAALRELGATEKQQTGRWLNNRVENSHLSFRRPERHATVLAHAKFTEIRLCPFLRIQPLQPGKIADKPKHLQADTHRRSCRVASALFRMGSRFPRQTESGSNLSDSTPRTTM